MIAPNEPEVLEASLVICTRNRPALLDQAIKSVLSGTSLPSDILVIDQSDVPHPTLGKIGNQRECGVRYKWKVDTGVSKARNEAAALAKHDLLVCIDDDVLVTPEWLGVLIRGLRAAGPKSVVTGRVQAGAPEVAGGFSPSTISDPVPAVYSRRSSKDVLYTGNMATYREPLRVVGGFDERLGPGTRFPGAEDNDLGLRLLEAGYRIVYVPEAIVYHRAWRNDYLSLRWRYGRAQGAFYAKYITAYNHYGLTRFRSDAGKRFLRWPYMLRNQRSTARGDVIYVFGLLFGGTEWLLRYGRARC